jgi:hypothetical protein
MQYSVCCVPVSAIRKEPLHTAEMVSQQLFGECCTALETTGKWTKIRCKYDEYDGWCETSHLVEIDENQFSFKHEILTAEYVNIIRYNGSKMFVPYGSSVAIFKKQKAKWQSNICTYKGEVEYPYTEKLSKKKIKKITSNYLNTPYLWGGKSVFGIDCSGFSQAVYKRLNIYLPRDSWQQAEHGIVVPDLTKAQCGDLCFFSNPEGRIIHVGILLNHRKIIHSSGKVRIDEIDEKGIINSDTGRRTHSIKVMKRYFR